ncbi:MAG: HAD family hydrolase [Saccharofermentanales bacterium]
MKYEAVIFDMDGTIIDSMWIWNELASRSFTRNGIDVPDNLEHTIFSMNFVEAADYCIKLIGSDQTPDQLIEEWSKDAQLLYAEEITLKPFIREFLQFLKESGYIVCLTTANFLEIAKMILDRFSLTSYFDSITVTSEVERSKLFPDVFLLTAKKHNIEPGKCIVFEDSFYAIKGAKEAGMTVIGVYDDFTKHLEDEIKQMTDDFIYTFENIEKNSRFFKNEAIEPETNKEVET